MLRLIASHIGGGVRVVLADGDVLWTANDRKVVEEIIKIYDEYPPLTTRVELQLKFMKRCLEGMTMEEYFRERDSKFIDQEALIAEKTQKWVYPSYFDIWVVGFTEAEGCFMATDRSGLRYGIGQEGDRFLIQAINQKWDMGTTIQKKKSKKKGSNLWNFHLTEVAARPVLGRIIEHMDKYPLLGEKLEQYIIFKEKYQAK